MHGVRRRGRRIYVALSTAEDIWPSFRVETAVLHPRDVLEEFQIVGSTDQYTGTTGCVHVLHGTF